MRDNDVKGNLGATDCLGNIRSDGDNCVFGIPSAYSKRCLPRRIGGYPVTKDRRGRLCQLSMEKGVTPRKLCHQGRTNTALMEIEADLCKPRISEHVYPQKTGYFVHKWRLDGHGLGKKRL